MIFTPTIYHAYIWTLKDIIHREMLQRVAVEPGHVPDAVVQLHGDLLPAHPVDVAAPKDVPLGLIGHPVKPLVDVHLDPAEPRVLADQIVCQLVHLGHVIREIMFSAVGLGHVAVVDRTRRGILQAQLCHPHVYVFDLPLYCAVP